MSCLVCHVWVSNGRPVLEPRFGEGTVPAGITSSNQMCAKFLLMSVFLKYFLVHGGSLVSRFRLKIFDILFSPFGLYVD